MKRISMVMGLLMIAWAVTAQAGERDLQFGGAVGLPVWVVSQSYSGGRHLQLLLLRPISSVVDLDVSVHTVRGVRRDERRGETRFDSTSLLVGMRFHGASDGRVAPYARLAVGGINIEGDRSWYNPWGGGSRHYSSETTRALAGLAGVGLDIRLGEGRSRLLLGLEVLVPDARYTPTVSSLSIGLVGRL